MQCARHQLFAGAGLAVNQHRDMALGKSANRAEHFLHGRRVANNFGRAVTALTLIDLIVLSPLGLGAGHGGHHLFDIKRLRQVFECSFFVGADGTVEIRVCRGDNDGQVGLLRFELGEQRDAIHAGHANITHHHQWLFLGQRVQHVVTCLKGSAVDARPRQGFFHYPPD